MFYLVNIDTHVVLCSSPFYENVDIIYECLVDSSSYLIVDSLEVLYDLS